MKNITITVSEDVARRVQIRYKLSWWDSLIIAAASIAGCETILSEDINHSQNYLGIKVVNPFIEIDEVCRTQ